MAADLPELSSITSTLGDLTRRISAMADLATGVKQESLAAELFSVERSLQAATKRLQRLVGA